MTREELVAAFEIAKKRGDFENAYKIEQQLKALDEPEPEQPEKPLAWRLRHDPQYVLGAANEALQGASFGLSDELIAGLKAGTQAIGGAPLGETYRSERDALRSRQNAFREENPGMALTGNVVGGIATGGPLKVLAKPAGAALAGGVAGYGFSDQENPLMQMRDTLIGAGAGFGAQYAMNRAVPFVADVIRRKLGRGVPLVNESGTVTDEAIDAIEAEVKSGAIKMDEAGQFFEDVKGMLTPEQLRRVQVFQRRGVTPVRANVTQSTDDFRNLQQTIKQSGELAETVAAQDAQMANAVEAGIDAMRPRAQNIVEVNANTFRVVDDVVGQYEKSVNAAYQAARDQLGAERVVGFGRLMNVLRQNTGKERVSGGVISAMRQELKNRGIVTTGWKANGRTDVATAEEVRQAINALHDPMNPQRNTLLRELKMALDEDVAAVTGGDAFAEARQAHAGLKRMIERGRRDKRDKTRGSFLEDVLDNKIPEEKIVPRLLTGREDDFMAFKRFLTEDAGEAGIQAWNDIRAQVLRDALEAATSTMGKGEGGQHVFNSRTFSNKLKNLKSSKKYQELFSADERALIKDIIDIGWLRTPQRAVATGSGPTGFAVEQMQIALARKINSQSSWILEMLSKVLSSREAKRQLNPLRETERHLRGVKPQ